MCVLVEGGGGGEGGGGKSNMVPCNIGGQIIIPFSALSFVLSSVLLSTLMANSSPSFKVGGSLYSCFSMETAACVARGIGEEAER